jgi:hypothetical protein
MEKTSIRIFIIILILVAWIISFLVIISAANEPQTKVESNYTWTKAVCDNSNFCQDYLIECKNKHTISMSPITGSAVKFSSEWHEKRPREMITKTCEIN